MKHKILFIVFLLSSGSIYAQGELDTLSMEEYAVPESPAFSMLDEKPTNLITPSSVKKISLELTDFQSFGVEISPLLFLPNLNLSDYNKNKFWYRTRLSVGKSALENGNMQISEGLRFTFIDKTDLRDRKVYKKYHDELRDFAYQSLDVNLWFQAVSKYNELHGTNYSSSEEVDSVVTLKIDSIYYTLGGKNYSVATDSMRNAKKKEIWNAAIFEMGFASLQESASKSANDFRFRKAAIWASYGTHFGKTTTKFGRSNQLLIGVKAELTDSLSADSTYTCYPKISAGARFYYGSNELRGYIQAEYQYINLKSVAFAASIGGMLKIYNGIWFKPAMNVIYDFNSKARFEPTLNLLCTLGYKEKK